MYEKNFADGFQMPATSTKMLSTGEVGEKKCGTASLAEGDSIRRTIHFEIRRKHERLKNHTG
jgi:hypothetical protein